MKITVYIDGFNLYYGCLRDTPYLWLDLHKMCRLLFPHDEIVRIKYFTAPIRDRKDGDPDRPNRQQIYFRALRTIPCLEIIEGVFLTHVISMKLANGKGYAQVIKSEEKGTDVNIATHLVHDAHTRSFERAVVISNDSDLVTPIRIVVQDLNIPVTVISPFEKNNIQLKSVATSIKRIRNGLLSASQFETIIHDEMGEFHKPEKWSLPRCYRITVDGAGIYEVVSKDCPKDDPRRANKPDGGWLIKKGLEFPRSVSFWTENGFRKYKDSGLFDWHKSVIKGKILIEEIPRPIPGDVLYEDEYQIIVNRH